MWVYIYYCTECWWSDYDEPKLEVEEDEDNNMKCKRCWWEIKSHIEH